MIRYQFKVKLYEEVEYILYEKENGKHTDVYLKQINELFAMAHFTKSRIIADGKVKSRYYLIYKDRGLRWTNEDYIAFEEACSYLEKLS